MSGHLSPKERNALLLGDREGTSGGGFPPSEAFREVLSFLHDNGTASTDVLHKVIRQQRLIALNDRRILTVWKTWEAFCQAILDCLAEGDFIIPAGDDAWQLGARAVPDRGLLIIRLYDEKDTRLRVTFSGRNQRLISEALAQARIKVEDLIYLLDGGKHLHPALEKARAKAAGISVILQTASFSPPQGKDANDGQEENKASRQEESGAEEEPAVQPGQNRYRVRGHTTAFVEQYMRARRGTWLTARQIGAAYDREYPPASHQVPVAHQTGSISRYLNNQVLKGECEIYFNFTKRSHAWRYPNETGITVIGG